MHGSHFRAAERPYVSARRVEGARGPTARTDLLRVRQVFDVVEEAERFLKFLLLHQLVDLVDQRDHDEPPHARRCRQVHDVALGHELGARQLDRLDQVLRVQRAHLHALGQQAHQVRERVR